MRAGVAIDFYCKIVGIETERFNFRLIALLLFVIEIELTGEHLLKELRSLLGSRQKLIPNLIETEIELGRN